ncbi:helix-turn-helix domain-containing protein [Cycloclasticus pugetii]|uniref:helix-turn-helix domain-containing protein n=1 Tax=Cycloclasticus pugetii TaxID=34068 RepID=UPI00036EE112|nr:helix-turn-helix transcriptional regulator [Cycloclasticus pugetii]
MKSVKRAVSPLARRLKEARIRKKVSQKELGILVGIDSFSASSRMNQYEKGKHAPDYSTVQRIAEFMEVPVCYFYTEDDQLAEIILLFFQLDEGGRKGVMKKIKEVI